MKKRGIITLVIVIILLIIGFAFGSWYSIQSKQKQKLEPVDKKRAEIEPYQNLVAIGTYHIVAVKEDGTVYSWGENTDGQCNTQNWTDIVAVSASECMTVGLKSDGTVVATGLDNLGQCETDDWTDIVEVAASDTHILGLKSDGTVIATGKIEKVKKEEWPVEEKIYTRNEMVKEWKNMKHVFASKSSAYGIKADGSVIWSSYGGVKLDNNKIETGSFEGWNNILELTQEALYAIGLCADGTVKLETNTENKKIWNNIVDIAAGTYHFVGLKSNGTVIGEGRNDKKQCEVDKWRDILAVYAWGDTTIGLKKDGTLIFTGDTTRTITENPEPGLVDPKEWDLF